MQKKNNFPKQEKKKKERILKIGTKINAMKLLWAIKIKFVEKNSSL